MRQPILHYSKDLIADYVAAENRYTALEAQQAAFDDGQLAKSPFLNMLRTFMNIYVYKKSYREEAFGTDDGTALWPICLSLLG